MKRSDFDANIDGGASRRNSRTAPGRGNGDVEDHANGNSDSRAMAPMTPMISDGFRPPVGIAPLGYSSGSSSNDSSSRNRNSSETSTTSSSISPIQVDEPYQGPSGPSFPYQLYPQNVRMHRISSGSTALAVPEPDLTYTGPLGPSFPYAMCPRTTVGTEIASPNTVPVPGIPVGFSGMPDNYRRHIAPGGEDITDLIGPDGHTEQLPSYSKYPEDAFTRKIAVATSVAQLDPSTNASVISSVVPVATSCPNMVSMEPPPEISVGASTATPAVLPVGATPLASAAPTTHLSGPGALQPTPGAGGLGLASRNPEFDTAGNGESPHSRHSLRSFNSDGSARGINTPARYTSEKRRAFPGVLQRIGRRRLFNVVPYWAICLLITPIVVMSVIFGSVIGTIISKRRKWAHEHQPYVPSAVSITVTADATPIPTPSGICPLPTGTFRLPLQIENSQAACFDDTNQAVTWSCSFPSMYNVDVTINSMPPSPGSAMYNLTINYTRSQTSDNIVLLYGEQAPVIETRAPMQLVTDIDEPNRGPAWFKKLPYIKTVIVPETSLSQPTTAPMNRRASIQYNKRPPILRPFEQKEAQVKVGEKPWLCTWPDTVLEVFVYPNQNASSHYVSLSSAYSLEVATPEPTAPQQYGTYASNFITSSTTYYATPTRGLISRSPPPPPPYPRVVKVEERRMTNSPQATCTQYELVPQGTGVRAQPYLDTYGKRVEIYIAENENGPPLTSIKQGIVVDPILARRNGNSLSNCGCFWLAT